MESSSTTPSFFEAKRFGVIVAHGSDAARFLHRMSTNSVVDMAVGATCLTAFLNQKARLVAVCQVWRDGDQSFRLLVPYDSADLLLQWLDQYLFVEDVTLTDQTSDFALFWTGDSDFPQLANKGQAALLRDAFNLQGSREFSDDAFATWRISREIPYSTGEINLSYHPIQLGLTSTLHWAKGCYIGQEVISRLESKDRSQKMLVGIKMLETQWATAKMGDVIAVGDQGQATLTSVAPLYLAGQINALGVMKVVKSALTA